MCISGGSSSAPSASQQAAIQQQQIVAQAQTSAAQLAEQQREFAITSAQNQQSINNTKALQEENQDQVNEQAAVTNTYDTTRSNEEDTATNDVNGAFAQFTPAYYKQYTQDYVDHYTPQVDQQFDTASQDTSYGLARTGNTQSQTAASQFGALDTQKQDALDDINNQAIGATTTLQNSVLGAKSNLMSAATSDATLGSPVAPGSIDAATAAFNATSDALSGLKTDAGNTVATLGAVPTYSSLGNLFGTAASAAASANTGNNLYGYAQASSAGASNPTGSSSATVTK